MAGTSISSTRTAIAGIFASNVGRVSIGWDPTLGAQGLYHDLITYGPLAVVGMPESMSLAAMTKSGYFHIPIVVMYAKQKGAAWTGQHECDVENEIMGDLLNKNYYWGPASIPQNVSCSSWEYESSICEGVLEAHFDCECFDPVQEPDSREMISLMEELRQ